MDEKPKKFCVFCGNKPIEKTNEHIVPLWLLSLTGNPKRLGNFKYHDSDSHQFAFDQFRFPACYDCNNEGSKLESLVRPIIEGLLNHNIIAATQKDVDSLLDWFDKIRIGMWLGMTTLHRDKFAIDPHFYINSRMGKVDRTLLIYRLPEQGLGLNTYATTSPAFFTNPACLAFRFNNYYFVSVSQFGLVSNALGFTFYRKNKLPFGARLKIVNGDGRPKLNCFPDEFLKIRRSATLTQALISTPDSIYESPDWVNSLLPESKIKTAPFVELGYSGFNITDSRKVAYYVPELLGNPFETELKIILNTFDLQNRCVRHDNLFFPYGLRDFKKTMKMCKTFSKNIKKELIEAFNEKLKRGEAGKESLIEKFIRKSLKRDYKSKL